MIRGGGHVIESVAVPKLVVCLGKRLAEHDTPQEITPASSVLPWFSNSVAGLSFFPQFSQRLNMAVQYQPKKCIHSFG